MTSLNFILNQANVLNLQNNVFQYKFPNGSIDIPQGSKIQLKGLTIPYSWYNITSSYGNNTFTYTMPTSTTLTNTVTVTIPDGFYTINDLNNLLIASLKSNGYYFYNSTSNSFIYPIQFSSQSPNYTNAMTFQYIPTSSANVVTQLGTGWTWMLGTYPTTASTATVTIPQQNGLNVSASTYGLGNILGFLNATYPSTSQTYSGTPTIFNSTPYIIYGNTLKASANNPTSSYPPFTALGSLVNGIIVRCNLVHNNIASNGINDVLDCVPINTSFGSNVNFTPQLDNSVSIYSGKYNTIQISFYDQNLNQLNIQDTNVLINLRLIFP